jgi:hypothetical protein
VNFDEFFETNGRFVGLSVSDQICRVAWFLHKKGKDRVSPREVSEQFRSIHLNPPRVDVYLPRLWEKKPPIMLWDKRGYFLEGRERKRLDDVLAPKAPTAEISNLLKGLTESVTDGPERVFLNEAIRCYEVTAFRAAIVMTWNLAYDHLRRWIIKDQVRLEKFNQGAGKRFQKSPKPVVVNESGFDEFKESEFLDSCSSGKVIDKNLEAMLREKLKRRNMAAHPSSIIISQPQADDVIADLIQNVIVALN